MEPEYKKPPLSHQNYLENIHQELEKDIKNTRDEIKNLLEKKNFYQEILRNASAMFFVINLSKKKITWCNDTYKKIIHKSGLRNEDIIKQVLPYYEKTEDKLDSEKEANAHRSKDDRKTGAIVTEHMKGKGIGKKTTYYFQSYTLKYNKDHHPDEILVTAFDLTNKIFTEHQLEELVKENRRLKNKLILNLLTNREKEIVKLVSMGLSSRQISEEMEISFYTVETHRKNILKKVEIHNSAELIRFATEAGLV